MPKAALNHSLIFIRENEGQLTGSDCCGKLEGDWLVQNGQPIFKQQRTILAGIAPLFLEVKNKFSDDIDISQVDPRNQLFLTPKIFLDIWRKKKYSRASFRSLFMFYRLPAIIFDGELLFSGRIPSKQELFSQLSV